MRATMHMATLISFKVIIIDKNHDGVVHNS